MGEQPYGAGAFDAELGHFQAAGQIISQTYQRIAYGAVVLGHTSGNRGEESPRLPH